MAEEGILTCPDCNCAVWVIDYNVFECTDCNRRYPMTLNFQSVVQPAMDDMYEEKEKTS